MVTIPIIIVTVDMMAMVETAEKALFLGKGIDLDSNRDEKKKNKVDKRKKWKYYLPGILEVFLVAHFIQSVFPQYVWSQCSKLLRKLVIITCFIYHGTTSMKRKI